MLNQIEPLLKRVEKPGRYVGGEVNSVKKNWDETTARIVLAFPDVYDVGMSYHGFRILYERINGFENFLADRSYTPWPDMDSELRQADIPLYTLDQMRPLSDFDVIGFTLQYELNYTNVLSMLDLSKIPLLCEDRGDNDPILIAGGEGALAPEPMAMFLDAFIFGDGEEVVIEVLEAAEKWKSENLPRHQRLEMLQQIPGVYVPALFDFEYGEDNKISSFKRNGSENSDVPVSIRKRQFNLTEEYGPVKPVVPMVQAVHDRLAIEIKRGCTRGCRFCAAGMITRPIRERTPEQILEIAQMGLENTGYRDISLLSLSSADYSCILPTVQLLNANLSQDLVSISLPSLRINAFDVELADEISKVKKTGFTFAPEAGSERLRRVISKVVDQDQIFQIVDEVCSKGWKTLKFYFMMGLPTEEYSDLDGIVEMVSEAYRIGRKHHGKKITINVSLSPFIPKPHTPFQWEPQLNQDELKKRYAYVADKLRRMKGVSLKRHHTSGAQIEAVLARGDRRIGNTILRAYELGCKFDGWNEWFRIDLWQQAMEETGIDAEFYANRLRDENEILPWDHVEVNLGKKFLWKERKLAYKEKDVFDCSTHACVGCVACEPENGVDHQMVRDVRKSKKGGSKISIKLVEPEFMESGQSWLDDNPRKYLIPEEVAAQEMQSGEEDEEFRKEHDPGVDQNLHINPLNARDAIPVQRLRFQFSKTGRHRFLSHLDMMRGFQNIFTRINIPLAMTKGFNPKPIMQFTPSLGLGVESECEYMDISTFQRVHDFDSILKSLDEIVPEGINFLDVKEVPLKSPAIESVVEEAGYQFNLPESFDQEKVETLINEFMSAESWTAEVKRKRGMVPIDLKTIITSIQLNDSKLMLQIIPTDSNSLIGPAHIFKALFPEIDIEKTGITRKFIQLREIELAAAG